MPESRLGRAAARGWQWLHPAPRERGPAPDTLRAAVVATGPLLERILLENIVAFWLPRCIDQESGGYLLHHDSLGRSKGPANKRTVAQARTLWFFARLARCGQERERALTAARHGFEFLSTRMWDREHGGFFWETDHSGAHPAVTHKYLLAQSFALYALAEYAMASGDRAALRLADDTFAVIEREFHDPAHGGYWGRLTYDWKTGGLPPRLTRGPSGLKTLDVHLHALEALAAYLEAHEDPLTRLRLTELLRIQTETVFRPEWGCCSDAHRADWTPLLDPEWAISSYGHDLENITLVLAACAALGVPAERPLDFFRRTFLTAQRWGYDRRHGGFYKDGPYGKPATDRSKSWWVQAEALHAALEMFRLTGDALYADTYLGTLRWIDSRQLDWEHGEWHAEPPEKHRPADDKSGPWKEPYHTGRAILSCLELTKARDLQLATP